MCTPACLGKYSGCVHEQKKVQINTLGQYVVFPFKWYHQGFTMIVPTWSLSLHNSLQGQVFHLIIVNPWAQYILEIKWLKVGWKKNPSLCWALTYWSTGTQHILYSIFNHARIFMFMGQWIGSATVKFPVLSLCPRRLLGHRGAWLEWRFSEEITRREITIKWIWKLWALI